MICLLTVGMLADLHQLFLMLLFPVGIAFNWLFFRFVSLAAKHSVVGFEHQGNDFVLVHKDGSNWGGELKVVQWNTSLLTILRLLGESGQKRHLVIFSDATDKETLRKFRVWLKTSM